MLYLQSRYTNNVVALRNSLPTMTVQTRPPLFTDINVVCFWLRLQIHTNMPRGWLCADTVNYTTQYCI